MVQGCDREKSKNARTEGVTTQSTNAGQEDTIANADDRQAFEALYSQLLQFRDTPPVLFSSNPEDYNDCEVFRKIVAGGTRFSPFVIEKIRDGDFFLNQAMREITGVDVRKHYNDHTDGYQYESKLWSKWWGENGKTYHGRRKKDE